MILPRLDSTMRRKFIANSFNQFIYFECSERIADKHESGLVGFVHFLLSQSGFYPYIFSCAVYLVVVLQYNTNGLRNTVDGFLCFSISCQVIHQVKTMKAILLRQFESIHFTFLNYLIRIQQVR